MSVSAEQLAAGFDRGLAIELDPHAIAQKVGDVLGEILAAERSGRASQDLE